MQSLLKYDRMLYSFVRQSVDEKIIIIKQKSAILGIC